MGNDKENTTGNQLDTPATLQKATGTKRRRLVSTEEQELPTDKREAEKNEALPLESFEADARQTRRDGCLHIGAITASMNEALRAEKVLQKARSKLPADAVEVAPGPAVDTDRSCEGGCGFYAIQALDLFCSKCFKAKHGDAVYRKRLKLPAPDVKDAEEKPPAAPWQGSEGNFNFLEQVLALRRLQKKQKQKEGGNAMAPPPRLASAVAKGTSSKAKIPKVKAKSKKEDNPKAHAKDKATGGPTGEEQPDRAALLQQLDALKAALASLDKTSTQEEEEKEAGV